VVPARRTSGAAQQRILHVARSDEVSRSLGQMPCDEMARANAETLLGKVPAKWWKLRFPYGAWLLVSLHAAYWRSHVRPAGSGGVAALGSPVTAFWSRGTFTLD
jgi:hypothetical protein